jgi:tetratricopeptide (TPR) repeat protein
VTGDVQGGMHGQMAAWLNAAENAKVHYERAGWPPSICRAKIAAALYHGPVAAQKAIGRCTELLEESANDRFSEAGVRVFLGGLLGMRGTFPAARDMLAQARTTYTELHAGELFIGVSDSILAKTEMLAGNYAHAEDLLRATCALYEDLAEHSHFATMAGELAQTLYAQERLDEAREFSRRAAERAAPDDFSAEISWRRVEAKILAREGATGRAETLAREAVDIASHTDALNRRAEALVDLAEVVRLDERPAEAGKLVEEARRLFARKGNIAATRSVRKLIELAPL